MKACFLFPGQGAQYVGMGKDFYDRYPSARQVFTRADEILGRKLSEIIFFGPEKSLTETKNAQLALFVVSAAILCTLEEEIGIRPILCAGLSLGEYTALYAAKKIGFEEALFLVERRASLMNEACEKKAGAMAAVLGLEKEAIEKGLEGIEGVSIANCNAPGQIVISGTLEGVDRGAKALKEVGAKRVLPLKVHGAFHSPLMALAKEGLEEKLAEIRLIPSDIDLVMNATGFFAKGEAEIKELLALQLVSPVLWQQSISAIREREKIDCFIEVGCGRTLAGLNRKMGIMDTISLDKVEDLKQLYASV